MSQKTLKNLEAEFSQLKISFVDLQTKFTELNDKHEVLEKKYSEAVYIKEKVLKCDGCEETFTTLSNLN